MARPPPARAGAATSGRLTTQSARAEARIATTTESVRSGTSYAIAIPGMRKASMPTKCMLQMPKPMAREPPPSHATRARPRAALTLVASASAV